jgi:hypothetical protein
MASDSIHDMEFHLAEASAHRFIPDSSVEIYTVYRLRGEAWRSEGIEANSFKMFVLYCSWLTIIQGFTAAEELAGR